MAPFRQQFAHPPETQDDAEEVRPERAFGGVATGSPGSAADKGAEMRAAMLAQMGDAGEPGGDPDPAAPPGREA